MNFDIVFLTTLLPSDATAEVISVNLEEGRLFLLTVFDYQITSRVELAPNGQVHGIRDLARNGIEPASLLGQLRDGVH